MTTDPNHALDLAFEYANHTDAHIFLTGKAGTGKTTFLHRLKDSGYKRLAVLAPTGVAAIHAGGSTIHAFFQLPIGLYWPGASNDLLQRHRLPAEKITLLQGLDMLVIDEVSMVRVDVLDAVDALLRRYRHCDRPFGGVQLLMIGDVHQLPPVIREEEWQILGRHYASPYFFSSHVLEQGKPLVISLNHIYRQSDPLFIDLLNKVRDNQVDDASMALLNSRYQPDFQPEPDTGYIVLSSHVASAQRINAQRLQALPGEETTFQATVRGDFPEQAFPTESALTLKTGAQVMFIKNDSSRERRYFNGKIGTVIAIAPEAVTVRCAEDAESIRVTRVEWQNLRHRLNAGSYAVETEAQGSFEQFPLRLAWAITIHKSQGLTFDRVILDAESAFAHGQVYVALSRCKRLEGIILQTPITPSGILTDPVVRQFSAAHEALTPSQDDLERAKRAYQWHLLHELFDGRTLSDRMERLGRLAETHGSALMPSTTARIQELLVQVRQQDSVFERFRGELRAFSGGAHLPENHLALQERLRRAASWFAQWYGNSLLNPLMGLVVDTHNDAVQKTIHLVLDELRAWLSVQHACLQGIATGGFSVRVYLQGKVNGERAFQRQKKALQIARFPDPLGADTAHPTLVRRLMRLRHEKALAMRVSHSDVLELRTIMSIAHVLPQTEQALLGVKGIGKVKLERFGADLLDAVRRYCAEFEIVVAPDGDPPSLPGHLASSRDKTLILFREGKSLDEIVQARGLTMGTIEGHLCELVQAGRIRIEALLSPEVIAPIAEYFQTFPASTTTEARAYFDGTFGYMEIKLVKAHLLHIHSSA